MNSLTHLLILGDHQLFNEVLTNLLRERGEFGSVSSTSNPHEVIKTINSLSVDLVLIDAKMTSLNVNNIIREMREFTKARVIVLNVEHSEDVVLALIEAGACGYVSEKQSFEEVLLTMREVQQGQIRCSPKITASVINRIQQLAGNQEMFQDRRLTRREREILELIACGLSNKEISKQLRITLCTVKNHVHNILDKLQVHRRHDAIKNAVKIGMLKHVSRTLA